MYVCTYSTFLRECKTLESVKFIFLLSKVFVREQTCANRIYVRVDKNAKHEFHACIFVFISKNKAL